MRRRGLLGRFTEPDEARLASETRAWAATIPGTVLVAGAPLRSRVRVAGIVRRITIRPVKGFDAFEVLLWDGSGEVAVSWLGRRAIAGLTLGSRLAVEGVLGGGPAAQRTMVNPTFEFLEAPAE